MLSYLFHHIYNFKNIFKNTEYKVEYKTDLRMFDSNKNNHVGHHVAISMASSCKEEILQSNSWSGIIL